MRSTDTAAVKGSGDDTAHAQDKAVEPILNTKMTLVNVRTWVHPGQTPLSSKWFIFIKLVLCLHLFVVLSFDFRDSRFSWPCSLNSCLQWIRDSSLLDCSTILPKLYFLARCNLSDCIFPAVFCRLKWVWWMFLIIGSVNSMCSKP